ncbi:MAG TPA: DinB family protein [Bryobacteraceae bacterium]|jgi:uncharacterized damage-inducible protein DinB|nr:DinB family protein [Bryobacteraceae bacterium]
MTLTAEQALFISRITLPTLKNEHQITKRMIEAIPPDRADYRPDNIVRSAKDLAWHIVAAENTFLSGIAAGAFSTQSGLRADDMKDTTAIAAWYATQFAANMERLNGLSGEDWLRVVDFRGIFQLPAFAYLNFAINHTIHHRGQLSTYLRPMGAKVPSIYGQSYDDAQAAAGRGV